MGTKPRKPTSFPEVEGRVESSELPERWSASGGRSWRSGCRAGSPSTPSLATATRLILCVLLAGCALNRPAQPTSRVLPVGDPPPCQETAATATKEMGRQVDLPSGRLTAPTTPESPLEGRGFQLGRPKLQLDLPLSAGPPAREAYFAEVRRLIQARMVYPREAVQRRESGKVALRFELAKDGSVRCISVDRSSGIAILDRATVDMVRYATLPPIPEALGDHVSITANFNYELQ